MLHGASLVRRSGACAPLCATLPRLAARQARALSTETAWEAPVGGPRPEERIPVTILTGFLGAGKTTLLNRILTADHGLKLAVIQNEFGEVGVDHLLTAGHFEADDDIFQLNNGCLCCTVRSDLAPLIQKLYLGQAKTGRLDGIIVETTGLAVPNPVAQTFLTDLPGLVTKLDAVITLVDAVNAERHLAQERQAPDAQRHQFGELGFKETVPADNDAARLSALARETAAAGSVDECKRAPNEVTEQIAFADKLLLNKSDMVSPEHLERLEQRIRRINPFAEVLRCSHANVDLDRVLNIGAFDLQRVAETLQAENDDHGHGHGHGHSHGHSHGHGHGHGHGDDVHQAHDAAVTSVAITHDGPMEYKKIEQWLGQLLYEHGESIYRMKGVLALDVGNGKVEQLVYQGVHMNYSGELLGLIKQGQPLANRLVFIGKHLDREQLEQDFMECRA